MGRKRVFYTKLSLDDCAKKLISSIDRPAFFSWSEYWHPLSSTKDIVGEVHGQKFFLREPQTFPLWPDLFNPVCFGRLESQTGGTNVEVRFGLGRPAQLIMCVYVVVTGLIVAADIATRTTVLSEWPVFVIGVLFAIGTLWGRRGKENCLAGFLTNTLKAKEIRS